MIQVLITVVAVLAIGAGSFFAGTSVERGRAAQRLNAALRTSEAIYHEQEQELQQKSLQWEVLQSEHDELAQQYAQRGKALAALERNRSQCLGADELRVIRDALHGAPAAAGEPDPAVPAAAGTP